MSSHPSPPSPPPLPKINPNPPFIPYTTIKWVAYLILPTSCCGYIVSKGYRKRGFQSNPTMSASPEYSRVSHGPILWSIGAVCSPVRVPLVVVEEKEEECTTPTQKEFKLPFVASVCPPAPRKPARVLTCKRRLSEFEFFVVDAEELESLFKRRENDQLISKKKKKISA